MLPVFLSLKFTIDMSHKFNFNYIFYISSHLHIFITYVVSVLDVCFELNDAILIKLLLDVCFDLNDAIFGFL